jgi:hypothetical protein
MGILGTRACAPTAEGNSINNQTHTVIAFKIFTIDELKFDQFAQIHITLWIRLLPELVLLKGNSVAFTTTKFHFTSDSAQTIHDNHFNICCMLLCFYKFGTMFPTLLLITKTNIPGYTNGVSVLPNNLQRNSTDSGCTNTTVIHTKIVTSCPEIREEPSFDKNCYR